MKKLKIKEKYGIKKILYILYQKAKRLLFFRELFDKVI